MTINDPNPEEIPSLIEQGKIVVTAVKGCRWGLNKGFITGRVLHPSVFFMFYRDLHDRLDWRDYVKIEWQEGSENETR